MKFMMLMIPAVYQGGKKVDPNFVPDRTKMEEMGGSMMRWAKPSGLSL
jgi:hypothetical protein